MDKLSEVIFAGGRLDGSGRRSDQADVPALSLSFLQEPLAQIPSRGGGQAGEA